MGTEATTEWRFDLAQIYPEVSPLNSDQLIAGFTSREVLAAIRGMSRNSAPGPDGFRPSFYQAGWTTVEPCVMAFVHEFYAGVAQLDGLNRAYMVLLPKKADSRTADSFRTICLQNCLMKILSKMLTTRLQQ